MSKVGQWVFEMQEDAYEMEFEEFIEKHGSSQAPVWYEVRESIDNEHDNFFMDMDDGA
jgi:hypothetical protein